MRCNGCSIACCHCSAGVSSAHSRESGNPVLWPKDWVPTFVGTSGIWVDTMKVALITGGAGAIGAATARMLAGDGFSVVLVDRAIDAASEICTEIRAKHPVEAVAEFADLADLDSIKPLIRRVGERFPALHCLVNNAGMTGASNIDEVDLDVWHDVLTINLTAPMLLTKAALPLLRASRNASIINVASRVYLSGTGVGYTSSKTGLIGLTR